MEVYKNQTQIKKGIFESEQQLANTILFSQTPKNHGRNSIKENYPFPYYDSTYLNKQQTIDTLKNKILFLKSHLKEQGEENINDSTISSKRNSNLVNRVIDNGVDSNSNMVNNNLDSKSNIISKNNYNSNININNLQSRDKANKNIQSEKKNNELHLFVIINNSTFPQHLSDMEHNLNKNSVNYTEGKFGYEEMVQEQIKTLENVYEIRKDHLVNFNNEMKKNINDVHDKK